MTMPDFEWIYLWIMVSCDQLLLTQLSLTGTSVLLHVLLPLSSLFFVCSAIRKGWLRGASYWCTYYCTSVSRTPSSSILSARNLPLIFKIREIDFKFFFFTSLFHLPILQRLLLGSLRLSFNRTYGLYIVSNHLCLHRHGLYLGVSWFICIFSKQPGFY